MKINNAGRSKSDMAKNKVITVRLDDMEYDNLIFMTEAMNMSSSEIVRYCLRKQCIDLERNGYKN